nr:penicillin-binding transpeptidase domain-containing protein [Actinomycetota bacterium]
ILAGEPEVAGERAIVPFAASLDLAGLGTWDYQGRLDLALAVPTPTALEAAPVVERGADPAETADPERSAGAVPLEPVQADEPRWAVAWSPATVHPRLAPGLALATERELQERAPLLDVDGAPLTGEEAPALPALAAQLLGRVGPLDEGATSEPGTGSLPGDDVGTSGLQAAFEAQLAGRPSGSVNVVDAGDGDLVEVLHVFEGEAPEAVRTTVDPEVQAAAEEALSRLSKPAALVAIDAPTGEVRAVASRPTIGFNRALVGEYPPGSTFKVVTTTALLGAGTTPESPASCPASASIAGFRFSNAGGEALGDIPFETAFFRSCNTAFVQLADELDGADLVAAAETYGFNQAPDLPVPAAAGSFPEPSSPVEKAAAAIGQGRVTASPLQMASIAAAVASGTWHPPQLTVPEAVPPGRALDPGVAETLRQLMFLVVRQGTATAAAVPGEPVAGKTGTAEFGSARPPRTHAWFIGFRGDLAVAVLVEDAGFGGSVAAPVARTFFTEVG